MFELRWYYRDKNLLPALQYRTQSGDGPWNDWRIIPEVYAEDTTEKPASTRIDRIREYRAEHWCGIREAINAINKEDRTMK